MRQILKRLLRARGYELARPGAVRRVSDPAVAEMVRAVRPFTMLPDARLAAIHDQVMHIQTNEIEGALVECGVWRGGSAGMVAQAVLASGGPVRDLHLFDTFEGIPEPNADRDGDRAIHEARQSGVGTDGELVTNPQFYTHAGRPFGAIEESRTLLFDALRYPENRVHFHQGFFQKTIPEVRGSVGPIAFLHVDGDWHDSVRACLDGLYDQVVVQGLVTVDDYGTYEGCRRAVDTFLGERCPGIYLHPIDDEARAFQKPSS